MVLLVSLMVQRPWVTLSDVLDEGFAELLKDFWKRRPMHATSPMPNLFRSSSSNVLIINGTSFLSVRRTSALPIIPRPFPETFAR